MTEKVELERQGYRVTRVATGEAAVQALADDSSAFDLVLMDIDLGPGIDGTQAAEQIHTHTRVPIVFLSSHTEHAIVEKTEKITSYGYVVKNSGSVVLDASIKMALRLYQSENRFRQLLTHAHDVSVQGYAADGTTQYWNPASERLYGYSVNEAMGKKLWDLIIPVDMATEVQRAVQRMLELGEPNPPETLRLRRKDGTHVLVRSNHVISTDVNGNPELFCIDIPVEQWSLPGIHGASHA